MSYMLFYIFVNFPSNWVIDVKGIKKGIVIGSLMTLLGCMIRCLVKVGFAFVVAGQVFCAIGQPFILNAPMKIATRWFMPQNVNNFNIELEILSHGHTVSRKYHWNSNRISDSSHIRIRSDI